MKNILTIIAVLLFLNTSAQVYSAKSVNSTAADATGNVTLTIDTTNITNFYSKVRSLFSATSPITYSNGLFGLSTVPIASGGTNNGSLSVTAGTVYYGDGSKLLGLTPGTSSQILHGGTTPSWKDTTAAAAGAVTSVSGTTNRITSTGGTTPVIDISSTFEALLGKVANPLSQFAATSSSQLAGVLSDETGTGVSVFGTSPTFTTDLTSPLVIGGTGTTSTLTFKTTTGVGATGADIIFKGGNNGGTEFMRIQNNGSVGIGTTAPNYIFELQGTPQLYVDARITGVILDKTAIATGVGADFLMGGAYNAGSGRTGFAGFGARKVNATVNNFSGDLVMLTRDAVGDFHERVRVLDPGRMGVGVVAPTAWLHLKAGTASASTAPLKLTSGTNLTTAEAGAFEYNGTNLFFTRTGTTRENIITSSAVNSVSPTAPNRTITVVIDGTTYYISAKTTND